MGMEGSGTLRNRKLGGQYSFTFTYARFMHAKIGDEFRWLNFDAQWLAHAICHAH